MPERGALGDFPEPAPAARAARRLRERGFGVRASMPAPFPDVVAALGRPRSPIQFATFPGALVGLLCGIALTGGTSLSWRLVTGGKPILSWPAFVVVIFELTVLFGALTNLVAVAVGTRLGARATAFPTAAPVDPERIVLFAVGDPAQAEQALRDEGAQEVRRVG
jgi:hypothetical protein